MAGDPVVGVANIISGLGVLIVAGAIMWGLFYAFIWLLADMYRIMKGQR